MCGTDGLHERSGNSNAAPPWYILAAMERIDEKKEREWLQGLPKTEIHVHLEGSIPLDSLWQLIKKYGGDPEVPDLAALRTRFRYKDFPTFIQTWIWKNTFIRSYEDFTFFSEAVAREFRRQNILYVEAHFTPPDFARLGLTVQGITTAVLAGLSRVPEVDVRLISDFCRDFGPARAERTLDELAEVPCGQVIGVGLGGSEQDYPPRLFAAVFERARKLGFHTTAHAGEAAGAESVKSAVEDLRAERIGHGTRAFEDPAVVEILAKRRIPVECCPISNLRTGVVKRIEEHPIRAYFDRGIPVTVNTDDPAMFETSLVEDFYALRTKLCFSRADILSVLRNGIECSWASAEKKTALLAGLKSASG
jgi:adenosine deaminase